MNMMLVLVSIVIGILFVLVLYLIICFPKQFEIILALTILVGMIAFCVYGTIQQYLTSAI